MKDIFKIDEKFDSFEDENIKYIDELDKKLFNTYSGLIFIKSIELETDFDNAIQKLQDPKNQSWGILENEVNRIYQELSRMIRIFKGFYLTNINKNDNISSDMSPQKMNYLIKRMMLRIKRLVCVLDPDYSKINFKDKKTPNPNHYTMIKGYWINDHGKRVRSVSRNIGNTESSINDLTQKLFKMNCEDVIVYEPEFGLNFKPDLIVSDGVDKWFIETKMMNIDNFIRTFVMFEMWKMYKNEYEIQDE